MHAVEFRRDMASVEQGGEHREISRAVGHSSSAWLYAAPTLSSCSAEERHKNNDGTCCGFLQETNSSAAGHTAPPARQNQDDYNPGFGITVVALYITTFA